MGTSDYVTKRTSCFDTIEQFNEWYDVFSQQDEMVNTLDLPTTYLYQSYNEEAALQVIKQQFKRLAEQAAYGEKNY